MVESSSNQSDVTKGAVAGIIGGLVGTYAMSEFQGWWSRAVRGEQPQSSGGEHDARDWQEIDEETNANELVAQTLARATIGRPLHREELGVAAPAVHYTFGAMLGGFYGALAERTPTVRAWSGAAYGTAVWAAADEVAIPVLGLSDSTSEQPFERHLHSFAAHLVFGVTAELVRRGVRAAMNARAG
jgi:putative membrane protein